MCYLSDKSCNQSERDQRIEVTMVTDQFINCLYDEEMELNRDHKDRKKKKSGKNLTEKC